MQANSTLLQRVAVGSIRFYQGWKWTGWVPRTCRFSPSCSDYAAGAIERYGMGRGLWLALSRIFRCRPGFPGGYDPIEQIKTILKY